MRKPALIAVVMLLAQSAAADQFSARALLAFERYGSNLATTSGFRQTYDLRLDKALTDNTSFRVFFRGDDFRGDTGTTALRQSSGSRQLQPGGEITISTSNMLFLARSEYFDTRSRTGSNEYNRTLERSSGNLTWAPVSLPLFRFVGQRNRTKDDAANVRLTDESAIGSVAYEWRGLSAAAEEHYSRSFDPGSGYDRKTTFHSMNLGYTSTAFGDKLTFSAGSNAQFVRLDETGIGSATSSVPTPVTISRALYSIDETPLDSSDHPAVANPGLTDGDLNANAGISIGPDGASFQNITLDIGHVDRVDEIRILVRDASGNPLRNGGGPVTWDAYTSNDGRVWTSLSSHTTFNASLSLYSITLTLTGGRWFKVVNFGVNADVTLVTEVQAYYHTTIAAGQHRKGNQTAWASNANVTVHPVQRLTFVYSGLFSSIDQELAPQPRISTNDIEHLASIQYDLTRTWTVRGQYLRRDLKNFARPADYADGYTGYLDYSPTKQLHVTFEFDNQNQTLDGSPFTLETRAVHINAFVLRSLVLTLDGGTQTQVIASDSSTSRRQFANLTGNIQLSPRLRMLLAGSLQRTESQSADPAVQLLGAERDNRISSDFIWRAGRELLLSVRAGWVSGAALSGFTQRYHVEWFPFANGAVSLGGSYDEDIDPMLNRRATRAVFNPRWIVNRSATIDLNYTSVSSTFDTTSNQQRSLYATLTLTR